MHLTRIQVPDYRVLKDVDISFEKDFVPKIFPLGSLNGGGKSTLLQLIFMLLHCSPHPERHEYLKNMLSGFGVKDDTETITLAIIDIWDGEKEVRLEFFSRKAEDIKPPKTLDESEIDTDIYHQYVEKYKELSGLKEDIISMKHFSEVMNNLKRITDPITKIQALYQRQDYKLFELFLSLNLQQEIKNAVFEQKKFSAPYSEEMRDSFRILSQNIEREIESKLKNLESFRKLIDYEFRQIYYFFSQYIYLFDYSHIFKEQMPEEKNVLLCRVENLEIDQAESFLKQLSEKVFLAAPITQVFLFVPKEITKTIFKTSNHINDYYQSIHKSKSELSGIFYYDFSVVDLLIKYFKSARDKDFEQVTKTGHYGNNAHTFIEQLNSVLQNKKINVDSDLSGINFKMNIDGEEIELYPEDLSHGELKRLSIYVWIKSCNIENAIVLMDEIEIAFHPDWQYQIIKDLETWGASNQYILATHSYELCQALTPSHVKELEPKLINH